MNITEAVAQLWCLPEHEKKKIDFNFAKSIVRLCEKIFTEAFESGREIEAGRKDVKSAVETLIRALAEDEQFYYAYQSNIAVQFQDEMVGCGIDVKTIHEKSNNAAKKFLDLFIASVSRKG